LGLKKLSSYSFDRIVPIFGYIVERTNTKSLSSHFFAISILNLNYDVINDVIMSDVDCTPGREPRSVAASICTINEPTYRKPYKTRLSEDAEGFL